MRRIAANYLFPVNGTPIKNGYVEIDDNGVVVSIGKLEKECETTEFYNGILCPGFTNAHCHSELSYLKGKFKMGTGMAGFIDQINLLRDSTPKSERIQSIQEQFENLFYQGVTAMGDISNCDESFEIKSKSPIYTRTFLEVFGSDPKDCNVVMEGVRGLNRVSNSFRIDASPTPHSPYTMSPELLRASSQAALSSGFLSYHNQESPQEEELLISGTGELADNYKNRSLHTPPVTGKSAIFYFLDTLQSIHPAPFEENILLIHNTATNSESIDGAKSLLKNSFWVTCPLSNLFIHNTLAPLRLLKNKGVKIAIGTDSLSSNHLLSMIDELKCIQNAFPDFTLEELLRWSCLNGAEAIGKGDIFGSFEKGKRPGVVLIDKVDFTTFKLTKESRSTRIV